MKRRLKFKWFAGLLAFTLLICSTLFAGTTGKIAGVVKDAESGVPLPGVNVVIKGTTMGAATNLNGEYFIINVPVSTYTLRASMVGYIEMEVEEVTVVADLTTTQEFELKPTVLDIGQVIKVVAERPLIQGDRTGSLQITTGEQLQNMPVKGYSDVVGIQSGVVKFADNPDIRFRGDIENTNTPTLNIRGGRADEVAYYVDGFSQQDPLTGISTTAINSNAIEQVVAMAGGFNAEYGKVMSGAVNVVTKEGTGKYSGAFEAVTDNLFGDWIGIDKYDYNVYDLALGGPLIPNNDRYSFYFSGERRWQRDRAPRPYAQDVNEAREEFLGVKADNVNILPHNSLWGYTWQGKLDLKLTKAINLKLGTLGSVDRWLEFRHNYLFNIEHSTKYVDKNNSFYAKLIHTLSNRTFYTLSGSYYVTERERGDGVHFDKLDDYGRPTGNPRYDDESLFYSWDNPSTSADEGHVWDDYLHRKSSYMGFDFDITSQVTSHHQMKSGLQFQRHTLRYYRHLFPHKVFLGVEGGGYNDVDWYGYEMTGDSEQDTSELNSAKHPITAALYLQDKIEYEGIVVNAGLRVDYLNVDTKMLKDEFLPLGMYTTPDGRSYKDAILNENDYTDATGNFHPADLKEAKERIFASPRLGIGFPVTDRTLLHINYGKFFQQPNLVTLYVNYGYLEYMVKASPYYYFFGNPNLKPEETTAYEVGLTQQLGPNTKLDITGYYKDVKNLVEVANIGSYPKGFASYKNMDYGTIKGLDFALTMRRTRHLAMNLAYSLSWAKGTGSWTTNQYNVAWTASEVPKMLAPLEFDQKHKLSANADYRLGKGEGPKLGSIFPLEKSGVNFILTAASGTPYTPMEVFNEVTLAAVAPTPQGPINSVDGPWTYRLDLKADREVSLMGLKTTFYLWVLNLLNRENAVDVYESSGSPTTTTWLSTPEGQKYVETYGATGERKYLLKEKNPNSFDLPRLVRFGIRINF